VEAGWHEAVGAAALLLLPLPLLSPPPPLLLPLPLPLLLPPPSLAPLLPLPLSPLLLLLPRCCRYCRRPTKWCM